MKYTIFLIVLIIISLGNESFAQNIESQAGIRLGGTTALTYRKMFSNLEAFEVMMSGRERGLQITGLYEKHKPMAMSLGENFYGYYGFGAHLGYVQSEPVILRSDSSGQFQYQIIDIRRKTFFTMGLDAIVGVEYHIYSIPMAIAVDFKPAVELIGMRYLRSRVFDFGVSAKYIF